MANETTGSLWNYGTIGFEPLGANHSTRVSARYNQLDGGTTRIDGGTLDLVGGASRLTGTITTEVSGELNIREGNYFVDGPFFDNFGFLGESLTLQGEGIATIGDTMLSRKS